MKFLNKLNNKMVKKKKIEEKIPATCKPPALFSEFSPPAGKAPSLFLGIAGAFIRWIIKRVVFLYFRLYGHCIELVCRFGTFPYRVCTTLIKVLTIKILAQTELSISRRAIWRDDSGERKAEMKQGM